RAVEESLSAHKEVVGQAQSFLKESGVDIDLTETIKELEEEMLGAANNLEFEKAALLRDQIRELKRGSGDASVDPTAGTSRSYGKPRRGRKGRKALS
ncbi:MAG TPA: UvrB/UvrC motif-containing protein, partial [Verrucomicrobiae bacterium]|nr:UvrB/UvrC motif-containing protein [Verrucomicrobiae bacterium]